MLPKLFFYLDELLGYLGDDTVLTAQPLLKGLNLVFEPSLATGNSALWLQGLGGMIEQLSLPLVEDAGLELVLVAQVGDRDLVGQVKKGGVCACSSEFLLAPWYGAGRSRIPAGALNRAVKLSSPSPSPLRQ